jgi:cytochrome oxidase Cu insertion factor (SCO1/SenC/PrrC family)
MGTMRAMRHAILGALVAGLAAGALAPAAGHPGDRVRPAALVPGAPRFDYAPPRPGSYRLPAIKPAADGRVRDAEGALRRLHDVLGGRITVMSFIFTRCADANGCPLATAVLHQVRAAAARDPELTRRLALVTLSFDAVRDTPAALAAYATPLRAAPGPRWEFVVPATERDLRGITEAYGQTVDPPTVDGAGPSHLLRVYLVDRDRRIRNIYGLDFLDPRLLEADVRTLLLEERRAQR